MRITALDVSRAVPGTLVGPDAVAHGICFDSRELVAGQAFVAIVGDRDGHMFIGDAIARGAAFVVTNEGMAVPGATCVETPGTVEALAGIARMCRDRVDARLQGRVVGITGSAGKTSTKNAVVAVLAGRWREVAAPERSLNNDIGVPVTIINAADAVEAMVLEMGMRGFGEIERLCAMARPSIGVVTNVGDAHSARVGGVDGVAVAKGELVESLPEHGHAVLNIDDHRVRLMASRTWANVVTYGAALGADVRWSVVETMPTGHVRARFEHDGDQVEAVPASPGAHMAANAAAAVAVGLCTGMTLAECAAGIGREHVEPGRLVWRTAASGARVLDDVYNANSTSMMAALDVLSSTSGTRRIAVLGRMHEIEDATAAHRAIAQEARRRGIEVVAVETDLYGVPAIAVPDVEAHLGAGPGDVVLVKGSRASAMERVVAVLVTPG